MEKIKKYWKEILIGLLVIFSLNKCTVACNRDTKIKKQTVEINQKDSLIQSQQDSLNILKIRWSDMQTSQTAYQGLAIGNQQELIQQIEQLKSQINILTTENSGLKKDAVKLKKQIQELRNNQ